MMIDNVFLLLSGEDGIYISSDFKEGFGKSAWRQIISGI